MLYCCFSSYCCFCCCCIVVVVYLQSSSHSLHTVPVPGVSVRNHAHPHQQSDQDRLPAEKPNSCHVSVELTAAADRPVGGPVLPERDEDHQFDAEEFSHGSDGFQLISQGPVEQNQAVHGKLWTGNHRDSD